jgi:hypothetical protein
MEFVRKNWLILAVALVVVLFLVVRKRGVVAAGPVALTGTYVPGTEEPLVASDALTHQTGATSGPAVADRSGRGHF